MAHLGVSLCVCGRAAGGTTNHISMHLRTGGGRQSDLGAILQPPRDHFGAISDLLGGILNHPGRILYHPESPFGCLEAILGASEVISTHKNTQFWIHLMPRWSQDIVLEFPRTLLGPFCCHLEAIVGLAGVKDPPTWYLLDDFGKESKEVRELLLHLNMPSP